MKDSTSPPRQCPQCGAAIARIARRPEDRADGATAPVRRYRCSGDACGWEGTLNATWADTVVERRRRRELARKRAARPMRERVLFWAAVGVACVALAAGGLRLYKHLAPNAMLAKSASRTIPFGVSDYGRPLHDAHPFLRAPQAPVAVPAASALAVSAPAPAAAETTDSPAPAALPPSDRLSLREDCAWGSPGRNPYQGSVQQALRGARLPAAVAELLERKISNREVTDQLEIRNDKIRGVTSDAAFEPRAIKMTFGKTLCLNTRVNFVPGHVERADLYEVADAKGITYSVMVPYVCGNVSVLGARAERDEGTGAGQSNAADQIVQGGQVGPNATGQAGPLGSNAVPEPGTWMSMLTGLVLLRLMRRRRGP